MSGITISLPQKRLRALCIETIIRRNRGKKGDGSTGSIDGNDVVSMSAPLEPSLFGDRIDDYVVVAGIDFNDNGKLENEEVSERFPQPFRIISQGRYDLSRRSLGAEAFAGRLRFRFASDFLLSFLDNRAPEGTITQEVSTISIFTREMDHNVGVAFFAGEPGLGEIKKHVVSSDSNLADEIRASGPFEDALRDTLVIHCEEVIRAFQEAPESDKTFTWEMVGNQVDASPLIAFNEGSRPHEDLFLTFGTATLGIKTPEGVQAIKIIVVVRKNGTNLDVDHIEINGSLTDLYDWNFDASQTVFLDPLGASVQAGFPTLGNGGEVFRTQVDLHKDIQFAFNFSNEANCVKE